MAKICRTLGRTGGKQRETETQDQVRVGEGEAREERWADKPVKKANLKR